MRIPFLASPNYKQATHRTISALVLHYSHGLSAESVIAWLQRPDSHSSMHYVIDRQGGVTQMVLDEHLAWHAGRSAMFPNEAPPREVNVNEFSLGIMLVGDADSGFTDTQMATLYTVVEVLVGKYHIPPERVVGHAHIAPGRQQDPDGYAKQFNWRRLHEVAAAAYRV